MAISNTNIIAELERGRRASKYYKHAAAISAQTIPPMLPAHVFDGLTEGANFGPPMSRPEKYAPISHADIINAKLYSI